MLQSSNAVPWGSAGRFDKASMPLTLTELQQLIRDTFGAKDSRRGVEGTFMWFMEEVGELAEALRARAPREQTAEEFADVLAWLATLANIAGVNLDEAITKKYGDGCPYCRQIPCTCSPKEKP
jgi:NTP pyrophosphatase (non-canonical NTP hydrolase)